MKSVTSCLFLLGPFVLLSACSGSDSGNAPSEQEPPVDVPSFSSGIDSERMLSSLSDEEISTACDSLSRVVNTADAEVACRIVAAGEATNSTECVQNVPVCLREPADALSQTTVRSTPGAIDCGEFNPALVAGCEFPVSLLEACVNSLAQSVVPAAEAVPCSDEADFDSVDAAETHANENRDTSFTEVCLDLLGCEALVEVLLGGD